MCDAVALKKLKMAAANHDLVTYRRYILEPRYIDARFEIANSHKFSRTYDFLDINAGDILGKLLL